MTGSGATHYRWDEMPKEVLKPDLERRLISTERMMLAQVYLQKSCVVPKHAHENEQLTYILEGVLRFWLGEDESEVVDVSAGECSTFRRMCRTGRRRWRRRSTSTSSARLGRTGWTARMRTCGLRARTRVTRAVRRPRR
jgi:hypothetical protein